MSQKENDHQHTLRRRAEEKAGSDAAAAKTGKLPSPGEMRLALHELRVYQIELEMQNEELRRAQTELEVSRSRYFDLYDLAPVGYFTLSEKGLILEANLTAAKLLGRPTKSLVRQPLTRFILPEDQDLYYQHRKQLFETGAPQECELRLVKKAGACADDVPIFWVHLGANVAHDADGATVCRVVASDITGRKRMDEALQKAFDQIKTLRGIVPICASCKKIRDDRGFWNHVETYIRDHTEAEFSHGICPECAKKLYPDLDFDDESVLKKEGDLQ